MNVVASRTVVDLLDFIAGVAITLMFFKWYLMFIALLVVFLKFASAIGMSMYIVMLLVDCHSG